MTDPAVVAKCLADALAMLVAIANGELPMDMAGQGFQEILDGLGIVPDAGPERRHI